MLRSADTSTLGSAAFTCMQGTPMPSVHFDNLAWVPKQGQLQGEGPLHSCPRTREGNHEGALLLLALIPSAQQQAGTHTRLEPA